MSEKKYQFNLDENQMGVINEALINMPYKVAAPIIVALNEQIERQESNSKESSNSD